MGNLSLHEECYSYVIENLQRIRLDENYTYIALGNFLTDLDQVRDPFSYFNVKKVLPKIPILGNIFIRLHFSAPAKDVRNLFDDLLGKPGGNNRNGALALFFTQIEKFLTHWAFSKESFFNLTSSVALLGPIKGVKALEPAEIDKILSKHIDKSFPDINSSQYYPHEHVDSPQNYYNYTSDLFQLQKSNIIGFLEEDFQYISEELTSIELDWVQNLNGSASDCQDILVRLGHILHAIEDYFFHSNFIETYQWQKLLQKHPHKNIDDYVDYRWLLLHGLEGSSYNNMSRTCLRRFVRRLHYYNPSQTSYRLFGRGGKSNYRFIFTGMFGKNDLYFTLITALDSLEEKINRKKHLIEKFPKIQSLLSSVDNLSGTKISKLVLLQAMFSQEERKKMTKSEYLKSQIEFHKYQLMSGEYKRKIEQYREILTTECAKYLEEAFKIDKEIEGKYDKLYGVGGFLMTLLSMAQEEWDTSNRETNWLNKDDFIYEAINWYNPSEEELSTNELLAKDSKEKIPFVKEATALAKHASASIAVIMAKRINENNDPKYGLDWDSILRHYLRFPNIQSGSWESEVINSIVTENPIEDVRSIIDQPNFQILGPDFEEEKLFQRRNGQKKYVLESRYRNLESKVGF